MGTKEEELNSSSGKKPLPNISKPYTSLPINHVNNFETLAISMQTSTIQTPFIQTPMALMGKKDEVEFLERKPQRNSQSQLPQQNFQPQKADSQKLNMLRKTPTVQAPETVNMSPGQYLGQQYLEQQSTPPQSLQPTPLQQPAKFIRKVSPTQDQATVNMEPDEYLGESQQPSQVVQSQHPAKFIKKVSPTQDQATVNMEPDEYLGQQPVQEVSSHQQPAKFIRKVSPTQDQATVNMEPNEYLDRTQNPEPQLPAASKKDPFGMLGSALMGKYKIVSFLGQGGMGAVYLAEHKILGNRAIKFLSKSEGLSSVMLSRFINEAKAAAKVQHRNVVQVYDIDETPLYHFIVMEFVKGAGLDKLLENGPLSAPQSIKIIKPIAEGLNAIHAANMIHRDVKPSNIMIAQNGDPKIMDFGIVKDAGSTAGLTGVGTIIGTPQFMSPEQVQAGAIDARSDIYSLGATFYYLVTNQVCFSGSIMQIMYQILNVEPIPPNEFNAGIDTKLSQIIMKMMEKNPKSRYQSMLQVIDVLDTYEKTKKR